MSESGLHFVEPYSAQEVQQHLVRGVDRALRRVYRALYQIREVHGLRREDGAWVLGVAVNQVWPTVPCRPRGLAWWRAYGLIRLQQDLDAGTVGVVSEYGGRRRRELHEEERDSYRFATDWRGVHAYLTKGGVVSVDQVGEFAGVDKTSVARMVREGYEPSLEVGERFLVLRAMIEAGSLQGWGEKRGMWRLNGRKRGRVVGEEAEHPFVALSRQLEGQYGE